MRQVWAGLTGSQWLLMLGVQGPLFGKLCSRERWTSRRSGRTRGEFSGRTNVGNAVPSLKAWKHLTDLRSLAAHESVSNARFLNVFGRRALCSVSSINSQNRCSWDRSGRAVPLTGLGGAELHRLHPTPGRSLLPWAQRAVSLTEHLRTSVLLLTRASHSQAHSHQTCL